MASIINAATSGGLVTTADTSGVLQLQTASTTAVTVDASQRVGIGTTAPAKPLNVVTSATTEVWVESTSTQKAILNLSAGDTSVAFSSTYNSGGTAARPFIFYNVSTPLLQFDVNKSLALEGATSQTGIGISFPSAQTASSDANTLDDYEEGTWTPTVTLNSGTATAYTIGTATYTKTGRVVVVIGSIIGTNGTFGSTNSYARMTGLPFTCATRVGTGSGANSSNLNNGVATTFAYSTTVDVAFTSGVTSTNEFAFTATYFV